MKRPPNLKLYALPCILVIAACTLLAYRKVFHASFISWDDMDYVALNADISKIDLAHFRKWWTGFYLGNYHPLTLFSYAIDYSIGKYTPFIYHFTNILLHTCNAVLLFLFARNIVRHTWVALFAALVFALHPVQTESVSWIAERKNVLYGFFFLLSLYCYERHVAEDDKKKLVLATVAGMLAMLSKAVAVSLPFSFIAVDICMQRPLNNKKIWLEKLPLLIAAIPTGIIAIKAQQAGAYLNLHPGYNWYETAIFAGYAYVQYIVHLLLPARLSVLYPYPREITIVHLVFVIIATGILYAAWYAWKKKWYLLCGGIVFYTVNIVLVLQFVQFGEVLMADRYLYIAGIGIWLPLAYYLFMWLQKHYRRSAVVVCSAAALACLSLTYTRNDIWLSEYNFWEAIVENFPGSSVAQNSMGGMYLKQGAYRQALGHIEKAITIDPGNHKAWYNKGVVHLRLGNVAEALAALNQSIALSQYSKTLFTRALLYQQTGQYQSASRDIEKVLQQEPRNAKAHYIQAFCLDQMNDLSGAMYHYNTAIANDVSDPLFYLQRGLTHARMGNISAAINDLNTCIDMKPDYAMAWYWRGIIKYNTGQMPCNDLRQAARLGAKEAAAVLNNICREK